MISSLNGTHSVSQGRHNFTSLLNRSALFVLSCLMVLNFSAQSYGAGRGGPSPKKRIQAYYKHLYETYKPNFIFSDERPVLASASVAYIFLSGHRSEFRGRELSSPIIRRSIQRILAAQRPDGAFGAAGPTDEPDISTTACAIMALRGADNPDYTRIIEKALGWFARIDVKRQDPSTQFLLWLTRKGKPSDAGDVQSLASWSVMMLKDEDPEISTLGLLAAALARRGISSGLMVAQEVSQGLPPWDALEHEAVARLEKFQKEKNVIRACITVRVLHHVMKGKK